MTPPRSVCLSASSLDVYAKCPRLFSFRYLEEDKLYFPLADHGRLGTQFHRLVEVLTPLSVAERQIWLDRVEPQLKSWWQCFCRSGLDQIEGTIYSEFPILVDYQGWQLQARYDRLVLHQDHYQIWDWKTGRPKKTWQTLLYPLLLHWGLKILPEKISVHFWYVNQGEKSFFYSDSQQQKNQAHLDQTLAEIDRLHFPKTTDRKTCQDCFFRYHCWEQNYP